VSGFGFTMRVQDSTFRRSLGMSAVKMQILATPLMLVTLVIMIVHRALIRAFGLPNQLSASGLPGVGFWLIFGVWIIACVMLIIGAYQRLGCVLLKPANARKKTLRLMRQITKRKGWHFDAGIFVIHCDDSFWREIVELCLSCASAAVVDVTEPSQNVIWELERAFSLMTPEFHCTGVWNSCRSSEGGTSAGASAFGRSAALGGLRPRTTILLSPSTYTTETTSLERAQRSGHRVGDPVGLGDSG
jgi:hypothetical protein